jgi:H+/Cl- antiporter ClcA/CBS domain-containing protein
MSLAPALAATHVPSQSTLITPRVLMLCGISVFLGLAAGAIAVALKHLIGLFTNLAFYQRFNFEFVSPADAVPRLGLWVIAIPVIGGIIVGFMARYGSKAIRGHGIPEAMEQVLLKQSKIPARMTFLKPLSAAVAIGTGGPFGAEGPIIATGGALGSLLGQLMPTSPDERKTLLAAGAAAGMAATFGSPISAVILAIELLLFEYRPRSLVPVAFAAATATCVHLMTEGSAPVFPMPHVEAATAGAMAGYLVIGAIIGVLAMLVTRAVYWVEDLFELIPIHWMWWPAIGGVAVGVVGYFMPLTLGVGYSNITHMLTFDWSLKFIALLCVAKFLSWVIALGSGTSGGTLAPLFTIGGAVGALLGAAANHLVPGAHVDPRVAALVGMAAIFAGASRAMLASVVFAFETTLQPAGLLPLLGGCTMAYLVSCVLMKQTIMTEKLARRGTRVPAEYSADFLDQILVRDVASKHLRVLQAGMTIGEVRSWIAGHAPGSTHQGFPLLDESSHVVGVVTRRDLLDPANRDDRAVGTLLRRPPIVCYDDSTLREAADHMVNHDIGRLPVVARNEPSKLVGIITRSDLLKAHRRRLSDSTELTTTIEMPFLKSG